MAEPDQDPQALVERRQVARALLQRPLTVKEHDPDLFRLVRRHEADLDRWFTQRLGYRLHVSADTARLHKTTYLVGDRPLRTNTGRPFHQLEYVYLALILASTAAGPAVVSLGDLVEQVRSAAADAEVSLSDRAVDRRAMVGALQWMIANGLAEELHATVEAYAADEDADAVLRIRPERITLLPLPALVGAASVDELLAEADRRSRSRQWMRARLVEDPVLYRSDLTDGEWAELRRRLGEEERQLHEMFGLLVESRAEGVAAIDPAGTLADQRFPTGGTVSHAALLLIEALRPLARGSTERRSAKTVSAARRSAETGSARRVSADEALPDAAPSVDATSKVTPMAEVVSHLEALAEQNHRWSKDLRTNPERLARQVVALLVDLRLAEQVDDGMRLLPAAGRFLAVETESGADQTGADAQDALW